MRLRYLLRVTVSRGLGQSVVRDFPFWVRNYDQPPEQGPPIKACGSREGMGGALRPVEACEAEQLLSV